MSAVKIKSDNYGDIITPILKVLFSLLTLMIEIESMMPEKNSTK